MIDELMEKLETEYSWRQPVMWNAIVRNKLSSFRSLYGLQSWYDLFDIRNIGPRRILSLVNFIREQGCELPWFAEFDEASDRWSLLEGCRRVPAPESPHELV